MLRKGSFLAALFLTLLVGTVGLGQAQATSTVRAIWNQSTLVIINVSEGGVDLSQLTLAGNQDSAITPDQWVMEVDSATTLAYSLYDVRPGSCLVTYLSGTEPQIPDGVTCTRIIGKAELANLGDIVWSIETGGFAPVVAGVAGEACDMNRTSCDLAVPAGNPDAATADSNAVMPESVPARALWNNDILVVINVSKYGADFTGLILQGANGGAISAENWVMQIPEGSDTAFDLNNLRPGACLVTYLSTAGTTDAAPELPENVICDEVAGVFTFENPADQVWSLEQNGFTPIVDGVSSEPCSIEGTTCDFTVPNADLAAANGTTSPEATVSGAPLRIIWNNDILVVINVSDRGLNLGGLDLNAVTGGGAIFSNSWIMASDPANGVAYGLSDVRPGSCLIAYLSAKTGSAAPALPSGVSCTLIIGEFPVSNPSDLVWSLESEGFVPTVNGVAGETCDIMSGTTCDVDVP